MKITHKIKKYLRINLFNIILYLIELIGVPAAVLRFCKDNFNILDAILIGIIVFLLTFIMRTRIYNKYLPTFEWDYIHTKAEFVIEFKGRESLYCHRNLGIKTKKKGVRLFTGEYIWTGNEVKKIDIKLNNKKINKISFEKKLEEGPYELNDNFKIELIDHMNINDETDCDICFELKDQDKVMDPMLYTSIVRPTEKLILKLVAPQEMVKNVNMYITTKYGDEEIILHEPLVGIETELVKKKIISYQYEVPKEYIKLLYNYTLTWQFCDSRKKKKKS